MFNEWVTRDLDHAARVRKAEEAAEPKAAEPHPLDVVGYTRAGVAIRRNGDRFVPGPFLFQYPTSTREGD